MLRTKENQDRLHDIGLPPDDLRCPTSWGKFLGRQTCVCHSGEEIWEHECVKKRGHWGRHECANHGDKRR
jgi:hypothetical protein